MSDLLSMPNIGETMAKRLANVNIFDRETLLKMGSRRAFLLLHAFEGDTCFSSLCGLEGAVQGIRWHHLSKEDKADLKKFFDLSKTACSRLTQK